jgi:uncharacterized protein with PIN domain
MVIDTSAIVAIALNEPDSAELELLFPSSTPGALIPHQTPVP